MKVNFSLRYDFNSEINVLNTIKIKNELDKALINFDFNLVENITKCNIYDYAVVEENEIIKNVIIFLSNTKNSIIDKMVII